MKEPNEIDLLFQSAFDGLEFALDPTMKEHIDRAIAAKKKRRRFLFILFPVILGTTSLAALSFYSFSGKTTIHKQHVAQNQEPQEEKTHSTVSGKPAQSNELKEAAISHKIPTSETKAKHELNRYKTSPEPGITSTKSKTHSANKSVIAVNRMSSGTEKTQPSDAISSNSSSLTLSEKTKDQTRVLSDTIQTAENKKDPIAISLTTIPDSIAQLILGIRCVGANQEPRNWSLSVLSYWEGEKKRNTTFENQPFTDQKKETASIHSATFYGKIEISRKLTTQLEVLTGIGFRSSKIVQYGYLDKIEIPIEGVSSGAPGNTDTIRVAETQSFRVNSIVLPIGLAYSFPIGQKMQIRLSGGGEFAYGQIANRQLQPTISAPKFRPFGANLWIRPEFHYSFGRTQLFGFGTFNQSLSQQLKWDFNVRRNPSFGVGIGLLIHL